MTPLAQDRLEQLLADTLTRHETQAPAAHRLPDGVLRRERVHRRVRRARLVVVISAVTVVAGFGGLTAVRVRDSATSQVPMSGSPAHPIVVISPAGLSQADPTVDPRSGNLPVLRDHRFTRPWSTGRGALTVEPPDSSPRLSPELALGAYAATLSTPIPSDLGVGVAFGKVTLQGRGDGMVLGLPDSFTDRPAWLIMQPLGGSGAACGDEPPSSWQVTVVADDVPVVDGKLRVDPVAPAGAWQYTDVEGCGAAPDVQPLTLRVSVPWTLVSQEHLGTMTSLTVRGSGPALCLPNGVHAAVEPSGMTFLQVDDDVRARTSLPLKLTYSLGVLWGASGSPLYCADLPEAEFSSSTDLTGDLVVAPGPDTLARFAD